MLGSEWFLLTSYSVPLTSVITLATLVLTTVIVFRLFSKRQVNDFGNKFVVITGCDTGFGHETAIRLDKMGVHVLATCLTKEGEQNLKSETSDRLKTFQMDVTNSQQIKDIYEKVKEILPLGQGLWGLVNNAGVYFTAPIEWTPLTKSKRAADVNLWGLMDVTKTFLPLVKKASGRVVNLSSALGRTTLPQSASYSITKYGVEAFSDALRREMRPWGVQVSSIEPGLFKTPLSDAERNIHSLQELWDALSPDLKQEYGEKRLENIKNGMRIVLGSQACADTYKVVDAIVDALKSQRPQARYVLGFDAKLYNLISLLPTSIGDRLLPKFL
ncbi:retinol dehydrogenase 7-like [Porites lutea]|uniref:retinol dehydrogenase 7-like n=1 Tax=Porites lutea TaxID=51062 RepID=UPI003CC692C0